jgi:hypothetical protein
MGGYRDWTVGMLCDFGDLLGGKDTIFSVMFGRGDLMACISHRAE